MLHRSSIINNVVMNIMIIEVLYRAKLQPSFVDAQPRDVIDGIRRLAGYIESVNRRCWVSLQAKSACRTFHIAWHWTKARYRRTCTSTRAESNVLLALRQQ